MEKLTVKQARVLDALKKYIAKKDIRQLLENYANLPN